MLRSSIVENSETPTHDPTTYERSLVQPLIALQELYLGHKSQQTDTVDYTLIPTTAAEGSVGWDGHEDASRDATSLGFFGNF